MSRTHTPSRRVVTPALAVAALLAGGCHYGAYFLRPARTPMLGLEVRMDASARRDCLVVMMPGMLNVPDDYFGRGFVADAVAASRRCDLVAIDSHWGYFEAGTLARRVGADVLRVAEARGYRHIWILGVSMGGLGAVMVAREHAARIDGLVLLGPFLGGDDLTRSIEDAGGLAAWVPDEHDRSRFRSEQVAVWDWLRVYATEPSRRPPLFVGAGVDDGVASGVRLLEPHLPPERHGVTEGGHDWDGLRILWRRLLVSPPWDPSEATPRIDR